MKFFVIEGGKGNAAADIVFEVHSAGPGVNDVKAEAERRFQTTDGQDAKVG